MVSNQVLQNTLEGLKEISRTEFCIMDAEGKVLCVHLCRAYCGAGRYPGICGVSGRQSACERISIF